MVADEREDDVKARKTSPKRIADPRRRDVLSLCDATLHTFDAYEAALLAELKMHRAQINTLRGWAIAGGKLPESIRAYVQTFQRAFDSGCKCDHAGSCDNCRANQELPAHMESVTDFYMVVESAWRFAVGAYNHLTLDLAMEELGEVLVRLTDNALVTNEIMDGAYDVAGYDKETT